MAEKENPPQRNLIAGFESQSRLANLRRLSVFEAVTLFTGITVVLIHFGFRGFSAASVQEIDWLAFCGMSLLAVCRIFRFCLIVSRQSIFSSSYQAELFVPIVWLLGILFSLQQGIYSTESSVADAVWTFVALAVAGVLSAMTACRRLAERTRNSAVLLVGSFLVVISIGALLLMLPVCRAADNSEESAAWDVALFTATSASCVTGLVVEPTGSYWSPIGHAVIFGLFQVGGLGILTFGAFLAVLSGRRGLHFREARTLRDMLEADSVRSSRRLLLTILLFTVLAEALGAVCLMGLWPDLPLPQRIWTATFHSVSAFCNAGFSLQDNGFLNMATSWQIWGPLSFLIILGGLGFPVVHDVWVWLTQRIQRGPATPIFGEPGSRPRLTLHSRLVLLTTVGLLLFGALFWFLLESMEAPADASITKRTADAWFQSVTFRTAGFNSVNHANMHPATKLLSIFLMFIGAAPGSTGGGIKTVVFAVTLLNIRAVFRGQDRVELFGRRIPADQVSRALSMIAFGIFIVLVTTGLLVIFERQPDRFLDHLFEATSAFGTVGVSAGITGSLTLPSRLLICLVMFLGRVGPVTLLLAMASPPEPAKYDYPEERVSLG